MKNRELLPIKRMIGFIAMLMFMFFSAIAVTGQEVTDESDSSKSQGNEIQVKESDILDSELIEIQLDQLKKDLYCPCGCDRMTFEICHCATAEQFKKDFRKALTDGETVEEIIEVYLKTYGPQFSAVMKVEGINIIAFTMPVVILLAIGGVIYIVRRQSREYKPFPQQDNRQLSDELQQKIESELEQFKDRN